MPQDKKYSGEPTRLEIGNGNTVREYVTINTGTAQDVGVTRIGDDNWIMAYRSEEHKSELQSLMRISYAVFCLKKKTTSTKSRTHILNKTQTLHNNIINHN